MNVTDRDGLELVTTVHEDRHRGIHDRNRVVAELATRIRAPAIRVAVRGERADVGTKRERGSSGADRDLREEMTSAHPSRSSLGAQGSVTQLAQAVVAPA